MTERREADGTGGAAREKPPPGAGLQRIFTGVVLFLVLANAVRIAFHGRHFVLDHPMNLVWVLGSGIAGVAVFHLNGARISLKQAWAWLGYGVVAAYFGFAVQGGINGGLMREMGGAPGAAGFAVLGLGAAASQTFGKWLVVRFVGRLGALRTGPRSLAIGLAVGLGFGLSEILILAENQIVRQMGIAAFPWLGIWERAVAVAFHVLSGALIAIAVYERRLLPIAAVVVVHTLEDAVAGAVSGGVLRVSLVWVEVYFSFATAVLWSYYRPLRDRCLAEKEPT